MSTCTSVGVTGFADSDSAELKVIVNFIAMSVFMGFLTDEELLTDHILKEKLKIEDAIEYVAEKAKNRQEVATANAARRGGKGGKGGGKKGGKGGKGDRQPVDKSQFGCKLNTLKIMYDIGPGCDGSCPYDHEIMVPKCKDFEQKGKCEHNRRCRDIHVPADAKPLVPARGAAAKARDEERNAAVEALEA
ncbi:MAG: hypothetical protein GY873_13835, partial [Bosea sp.]|uniref:hypothetical protein n=1 Tax=Bosea sp. (in: a-proteobacteria) TaxID=1871050 RepID=UPI0023A6F56B|nr:hypothetical protein [Bosea sp. (in: a-proteobacteria)]